jgi:pimeloyl-ACP methyl ester carboxylesterase
VGAAHAAHLEQPALCARIVESWLAATEPAG